MLIASLFLGLVPATPVSASVQDVDAAQAAVRWLRDWAEEQLAREGESGSPNEEAKKRAVFNLLAYLLELHPEYELVDAETRQRIAARLVRYAQGERAPGEDALETWNQAFCALALTERGHHGASDGDAAGALVARIQSGQRSDGGWGHGFRGSVASYPSTLIAATNGSLLALGLFESLGLEIDEDCVERGLTLYETVRAQTGALPYGGPLHRTDFEAGRTAGALAAMTALGRTNEETLRCTADYLFVNVLSIPESHGSPAFHVFEGALTFYMLGDEAWERYDHAILEGVRSVQRGDGSFDDLYEGSPDSHPAMGSDELNRAYRTALYTAALGMEHSMTAMLLRELGEDRLPVIVNRHDPNDCCVVWGKSLQGVRYLFADAGIVATVEDSGRVGFRSAANGELLREAEHELDCDFSLSVSAVEQRGDRVLVQLSETRAQDFDEDLLAARVFRAGEPPRSGKSFLACFSISGMRLLWNRELERQPWAIELTADDVFTLATDGGLNRLDANTGTVLECRSALPSLTTCVVESGARGEIFLGTDATLQRLPELGNEGWTKGVPTPRDATAPIWTSAVLDGATLWTGSTDGIVRGIDAKTGETRRELLLRAAIRELFLVPGQDSFVLAVTDDGRVCALSDGALAWEINLAGGHEWRGRAQSRIEGERLWIAHTGHGNVRCLDLLSGEVATEFALPVDAPWTISDGQLIYALGDRLLSMK